MMFKKLFTESTINEASWSEGNDWYKLEKRDYYLEVTIKEDGWEIWVGIKRADNIDLIALNNTSDEWNQEATGYVIEGTTAKQLKDTLKVLKAKSLPKSAFLKLS